MNRPLVHITGFREFQQQLSRLATDRQRKNETLKLLRRVAQGTIKVARQKVPKSKKPHLISGTRTRRLIQPRNLEKSIGSITGRKGRARENAVLYVGPRAKGSNDGFYGNWVELGHNIYRKGVKRRRGLQYKSHNNALSSGKTQGAYFMKDTYNETKGQVTEASAASVAAYIQKSINRLSVK